MLLTSSWGIDIFIFFITITFLLHKYMSRNYDYWKKKKVAYIEPTPFVGNFLDIILFKRTIGEYFGKLYNAVNEPYFGIFVFDTPYLVVKSPELIKMIFVKDFNYFDDRTILSTKHDEMAGHMLFQSKNPDWKMIRTKMTPIFTTGKMKTMIAHINNVGDEARRYLQKHNHETLEAKEICAKFTTDVIAKCAFAINAHSFDKEDAAFRTIGRLIFDFRISNAIQQTSYFFFPVLVNLFRLKFIDQRASSFLRNVFWDAIKKRENSDIKGNDLIDLIVELKKNKEFSEKYKFEGDKVVAQAVIFFFAGFETSSSAMAFTLYELCIEPKIQQKIRSEIKACFQKYGEFTYEAVQSMKYLHMCVCETLRKYPVLPFLDRRCNTNYQLPGTDLIIEKGTPIYIPLFGLHYDSKYFPKPKQYDPERFSDENIKKLPAFVYMPFGEGPRNCIGERFGIMSTKLGLIHILSEFEVEKTAQTPIPLEFEPKSLVLASKVGLPMKFTKSSVIAA